VKTSPSCISKTGRAGLFAVLAALLLFWSGHDEARGAGYPRRIVSLGPLNTENLYLLGAGDLLVADTVYCLRPEEARGKEKVGTLTSINMEKIVALQPDLVLATALTPEAQVARLRAMGLRVVRFKRPESFEAICNQLRDLAGLLGLEKRAEEIIAQAQGRLRCIMGAVSSRPKRRVLLQVGANPIFVALPGSFTHDYIRLGGGRNIAADQDTGLIGMEKIIARDPEVIIIAIMGSEGGLAEGEKRRWMRYRGISAVRTGSVHTVSPDLVCSPSPATFVEALASIASIIHPEVAEEIRACIDPGYHSLGYHLEGPGQ
jgi:iron complex transport system substrate-binding protein